MTNNKANSTATEPRCNVSPDIAQEIGRATAQAVREYPWRFWLHVFADVAVIGALVFAVLMYRRESRVTRSRIGEVEQRVEQRTIDARLMITSRQNGDTVLLTETVRGITPFRDLYHYVVVTPVKTGTGVIQPGPVAVGAGGSWTGIAKFGDANLGVGELYMVRCLATRSKLQAGAFTVEPRDAVFSDPVFVVRGR